jgi:galactose mutarotase-like enzyme
VTFACFVVESFSLRNFESLCFFDDFVSFRHTNGVPVLGPYMGRVSSGCTVIGPVRRLTYD